MAMPTRTIERRESAASSAAAELAACTSGTGGRWLEHVVEALELRRRVLVVGLVGHGEVGVHTGEPQRRRPFGDRRAERAGGVPVDADPLHAGVDLEVHRQPGGRSRTSASRASRVYTVGVSRCLTMCAAVSGGCSLSSRIGASIPACRSSIASATIATHSPSAPASIAARATPTAPWP